MRYQTNICSISACGLPRERRGWCSKHYARWKTHGDPLYERDKTFKAVISGELWLPVVGWEGLYEVSSMGRVWRDGRILKLHPHRTGYLQVGLWRRQSCKRCYVARLVAEAFLGTPAENAEANHISGIKTDNRLVNLEWITPSGNIRHAFATGLKTPSHADHTGEHNGRSRLTVADIPLIRQSRGEPLKVVAARFGVGLSTISNIWSGNTWKSVP
jgi:hypothetical protein